MGLAGPGMGELGQVKPWVSHTSQLETGFVNICAGRVWRALHLPPRVLVERLPPGRRFMGICW